MSRLDQLKKLLQIAPNDPMSHYGLGLEYINLQNWVEAAGAFDAAIRVDPKYSAAYYHKARALIAAGQHPAARETLDAGLKAADAAGDWHTMGEMRELMAQIP
jgi:tetratricopeptide (TPR) repeat protein